MCSYEGKKDGARVVCVQHALVGDPKRFWEDAVSTRRQFLAMFGPWN